MKILVTAVTAAIAVIAASVTGSSAQAQNRVKDCAAQWNALKAANQTEGKTYREFQKGCMVKPNDLASQAGSSDIKADKPVKKRSAKADGTAKKTSAKTSAGREAANARRRACGAEWKADKAAGKVTAGMKWPQYWSACNKRKKAESA